MEDRYNKGMQLIIDDLKNSNEFLQSLYDNVTSAIFIADADARIYHFNDAFSTLFYKSEDQVLKQLCGNVIGCSFHVEEGLDCGSTSHCRECVLRSSIFKSFTEKVPVYKQKLERIFYINGKKVRKIFIFTTRYVLFRDAEMILIIVDDITELEDMRLKLENQNKNLKEQNDDLEEMICEATRSFIHINRELVDEKLDKQRLVLELQHRVGNTLHLKTRDNYRKSRQDISEFIDQKTRCLTLIHECLAGNRDYSHIKLNRYVYSLRDELYRIFGSLENRIDIEEEDLDIMLSIEQATPFGLLVHEFLHLLFENENVVNISFALSMEGDWISTVIHAEKKNATPVLNENSFSAELISILLQQLAAESVIDDSQKIVLKLLVKPG